MERSDSRRTLWHRIVTLCVALIDPLFIPLLVRLTWYSNKRIVRRHAAICFLDNLKSICVCTKVQ